MHDLLQVFWAVKHDEFSFCITELELKRCLSTKSTDIFNIYISQVTLWPFYLYPHYIEDLLTEVLAESF